MPEAVPTTEYISGLYSSGTRHLLYAHIPVRHLRRTADLSLRRPARARSAAVRTFPDLPPKTTALASYGGIGPLSRLRPPGLLPCATPAHTVSSFSICWLPTDQSYDLAMTQGLKEIEIAPTRTIATLGSEYTIMAECACGHIRELHTLFLRRHLGAGVTIAGVRAKLRCHKCQERAPAIKVYRAYA
jgi:hypothetical protein